MELEPTSETGKRLNELLNNWLSKASDLPVDVLARVFLMYAMKTENQENFLDAMYGQRVLQEPHWDVVRNDVEFHWKIVPWLPDVLFAFNEFQ